MSTRDEFWVNTYIWNTPQNKTSVILFIYLPNKPLCCQRIKNKNIRECTSQDALALVIQLRKEHQRSTRPKDLRKIDENNYKKE